MRVFIDAGHGGKDPGAMGNGLREKGITLAVGLEVGEILQRHNVEVSYSRTTDTFIELADRAAMANKANADIFVSIHVNSAENKAARGVETFSYPSSTKGITLAKNIQDSIIKDKAYTKDRGIKTANFAVLRLTNMPSALIEMAFITNVEDSKILKDKQNELAIAIARGVLNYLGIKYVENKTENKEEKKLDKIKTNLHGRELEVDGIYREGINYIPVRFLEQIGYAIDWRNGTVTIDYKEE